MAIFDIFSKRQKVLRGDVPDVYTYDEMSKNLSVQIVYIWDDALGNASQYNGHYGVGGNVKSAYQFITETHRREYGVFRLPNVGRGDFDLREELIHFFLSEADIEKKLDAVELSFRFIDKSTRNYDYLRIQEASDVVDSRIRELNARFKEHGLGYQYLEGEIIRVDSEFIHVEAVKPALRLLNEAHYKGAQQEFLSAYEHYRHGRNKESMNDCLKSFESTMKSICERRGWEYKKHATAKPLIKTCLDYDLVPKFWQQNLTSLASLLESSIPTGRNKLSGHGQGNQTVNIPQQLVAYMLHMTASTVVFLTQSEKEMP